MSVPDEREGDDALEALVESFLAARRRGEAPTIEGFLARHPGQADELRELLVALEALDELEPAAPAGAGARPRFERLGPYRILRELGRGGMGLVYEAVQEELGRRVALKVLPEHRLARESDVLRFTREAMLASRLDHPAICTVYESGREADSPYIAMRYIEGESLAQLLARTRRAAGREGTSVLRLPAARGDSTVERQAAARALRSEIARVVRLIERTARGLHAAHEAGIVHRDIKPGNIMVGLDGNPVILDFGMARLLEAGGDEVTRTGDVCGTPAYMSPEQISGKAAGIDRETDVYSLGVTLFECLTLRLPFESPTREGLYRAILLRDAPDARSLNPSLPRDLAAVLEIALEKSPGKRYRTALEFADDLQRFLELRPVRARPIGGLRRALRAARRHPARSSAVALGLLLLIGTPTLIAVRQKIEGAHLEGERRRTRDNYREARETVDRLLEQVGEERLDELPAAEPLRRQMLDQALSFYVRMQAVNSDDPEVRLETAQACRRVGFIQDKLGRFAESESAFREALAQLEELCRLDPASDARRLELAQCQLELAELLLEENRTGDAEALLRGLVLPAGGTRAGALLRLGQVERQTGRLPDAQETLEMALRELEALAPAERASRALVLAELGDLQAMRGQLLDAGRRLELSVEIGEGLCAQGPAQSAALLRLARGRSALARFWASTGRAAEAEQAYLRALAEMEELVRRSPGRIAYLRGQADVQNELASLWMRTDRGADALRGYERALELQQRVVDSAPEQAFYREALSHAFSNLGYAEARVVPEAAERHYKSGIQLSDRLASEHPEQPRFVAAAANDHDCLGSFLYEHGRAGEAEPEYLRALVLRRALVEQHPEVPDYLSDLGGLLHNLARIVRNRGDLAQGRAMLEEAVCLQLCALEKNPRNPLYRDYLLNHREGLAETNLRMGQHRAAAREAEECLRLVPGDAAEHAFAARILARCEGLAAGDYSARALAELERALEAGAIDKERLAQDKAFAALRGSADFERLAR